MSRNELIDIFKRHIMPKPQRRQKNCLQSNSTSNETLNLAKEVKRIKLSRVNTQVQPMDCTPANDKSHKRSISESQLPTSCKKRQRIKWP